MCVLVVLYMELYSKIVSSESSQDVVILVFQLPNSGECQKQDMGLKVYAHKKKIPQWSINTQGQYI